MNAVERLWRALAQRDWAAARSQFRPNATVAWPPGAGSFGVEEYVARVRERAAVDVEVLRMVAEGHYVAVEARAGVSRCAAFYDLHDGLIVSGTEYWVGEGA